jgi:hypothetical protein
MLVAYPLEAVVLGVLAIVVGGPIQAGAVFWGCLYGVRHVGFLRGAGVWADLGGFTIGGRP